MDFKSMRQIADDLNSLLDDALENMQKTQSTVVKEIKSWNFENCQLEVDSASVKKSDSVVRECSVNLIRFPHTLTVNAPNKLLQDLALINDDSSPNFNFCADSTANKSSLESVIKSHPSVTSVVLHKGTRSGEKSFTCNVCERSFLHKSHLKVHMRLHTGEKPFSCKVCKRNFTQTSHLKSHMRLHTGEKPFTCKVCKQSFTQKHILETHIRLHTGEKSFTCKVCKRSFTLKQTLKVHMRLHTGEKPFSCKVCKRNFTQKSNLKTHIKLHTGEKPFTCNVCKRSFIQKSQLNYHLKIHTEEKSVV